MTSQSRLSPGIEINEIDRSSYGKQDYSIVGTTTFLAGFAKRGEDYTTQWVNTMATYEELYGEPENEPEKYLYNGVKEILDNGGVAIVSKLPYDNKAKDAFTAVTYELVKPDDSLVSDYVSDISSVDPSLTSVLSIMVSHNPTERISMATLDKYRVSNSLGVSDSKNKIKIVDITRGHYDKIDLTDCSCNIIDGVECLGLMPVITTPVNAMFYQSLISSDTSCDSSGVEFTKNMSRYTPVINACNRSASDVSSTQYVECQLSTYMARNAAVRISAETLADSCVAKMAVEQFPDLTYMLSSTIDREHMKHIGVAVFKVFKDTANDNKINFDIVESFVGSLDCHSKNSQTAASDYIGDIINSQSKYINFFANVRTDSAYKNAQTFVTAGQTAPIIGFAESELDKHIDYKNSIIDPLNLILDRIQDPNQIQIDVIADAGVSNIASFAARHPDDKATESGSEKYDQFNSNTYPFFQNGSEYSSSGSIAPWNFEDALCQIQKWYAVLKKFDDFCKYTRRDCIFLADMFRPVVLEGNEKIVRNTNSKNTIANAILPKLKHVTGLNSSYSAGYSNWFFVKDSYSGDFFWCPPSIKAAGIYTYTDAYFHQWDAPAGLVRGVVRNAYDVSYNPRNDEAGRIYQQAWNYAVSYPMEGIVLEGQKTCQLKPTALDRVNVRRLMLWIERRVVAIARRFLYEGNTSYMRQRFVDAIQPILEEAKNGSGISDYAVRCDDELNDTDTIERNEMKCIIAIKPIKTIEFIKVGFIISNQSASVSEEVMK